MNPFVKRTRIREHIEYLRKNIEITDEADSKTFAHVYEHFCEASKTLKKFQIVRLVVGVLLYVSALTAIAKGVAPGLLGVISSLAAISSLIGAAVLGVLFFVLTYLCDLIRTDLLLEHAHLVALLTKHNNDFIPRPKYRYGLITKYA